MEAMLSGVPVISTAVSGIPELVVHSETGLLAETAKVASLVECIQISIDDIKATEDRVKTAVSKVEIDFSLIVNTKRLFHLFQGNNWT